MAKPKTSRCARRPAATLPASDGRGVCKPATRPVSNTVHGVLRTNDPLLLERGNGGVALYRDLVRDGKVFACRSASSRWWAKPWRRWSRGSGFAQGQRRCGSRDGNSQRALRSTSCLELMMEGVDRRPAGGRDRLDSAATAGGAAACAKQTGGASSMCRMMRPARRAAAQC